jgi:hypothetical protein
MTLEEARVVAQALGRAWHDTDPEHAIAALNALQDDVFFVVESDDPCGLVEFKAYRDF